MLQHIQLFVLEYLIIEILKSKVFEGVICIKEIGESDRNQVNSKFSQKLNQDVLDLTKK